MKFAGSKLRYSILGVCLAIFVGGNCFAHEFKAGDLVIDHPWTRATAGGAKVGGGYLSITNKGSTADKLTGVSLVSADHGEIHEMKMDGGVMSMREIPGGVEIKPGQTVKFEPGGYHVMFMGLKEPLKEGTMVKGQLKFEKAGTIDLEFAVNAIGASGDKSGGMSMEHKH